MAQIRHGFAEMDEEVESLARPMRDYAELIPEPGVGMLRFDDFPFQAEWYSEEVAAAPEVVMLKATQIGGSAYWWRWAVRQADQFGDTVLYIFPTETHVQDFGDQRIEPAIEQSSYLTARIAARFVHTKKIKRIGRGFLLLRGSNSKAGAQSVAAQDIVFDEYDLLDPVNLPQIERRITGAKAQGKQPKVRRLGTPTIEGFGIDAAYKSTDQRVWMVACVECDREQEVTWEESVRWRNEPDGEVMRPGHDEFDDPRSVHEVWRQCCYCREHLDVRRGRWVAKQPGRQTIGFYVPRLIVPMTDLAQIVVASRSSKPQDVQTFENNDLGRAFSPSESTLDAASILAACQRGGPALGGYQGPYAVTMGVDVAGERDLNVRISEQLPPERDGVANPRRALWIGRCTTFTQVAGLMDAFAVAVCVIDSNPERRMAKALRTTYPGRVILCTYDFRDNADALKVKEMGEAGTALEGVPLMVTVNRTEAIDAMMDSIRQGRNFPLADPPAGYVDQMRAMKRRLVIASNGRPRREYVTTGTQGDDYAHAEVFDLIATELWRVRAGVQQARPRERGVPDEEAGFKRVRLSGDGVDEYRAGFGDEGGL